MSVLKIKQIGIDFLHQWFATLVDTINYNNQLIQNEVVALDMQLTNIDTVPIQILYDSLNKIINDMNVVLEEIDNRITALEQRIMGGR